MKRIVQPEWLDSLPVDDPRAIGSRRDLVKLNACMRHAQIMGGALQQSMNGSTQITELGAGDGRFLLSVARNISSRKPVITATLLDRQDAVSVETHRAFTALGWSTNAVRADAFEWLRSDGRDGMMVSNLFLHHFEEDKIAELFGHLARRVELFVAVEPRRAAWPLFCSRLLWGIGCNDVTRHDAVVSVQAGFNGDELTRFWPEKSQWRFAEGPAGAFSHLFVAQKIH